MMLGKVKCTLFNRDLIALMQLPFTISKMPFIVPNKILGNEITTSIIKMDAAVFSASNINFFFISKATWFVQQQY